MADLTLTQRFGSSATFNETTKQLTIDLNDLTDTGDIIDGLGLDISAITAANIDSYVSKILHSLLLLNFQQQPATNTDETIAIFALSRDLEDFNLHLTQEIPIAHQYESNLKIEGLIVENNLNLTVADVTSTDTTSIELSTFVNTENESSSNQTISIDGSVDSNQLILTVATENSTDTTTINLPFVLQEDFDDHISSSIDRDHGFEPEINITTFTNDNGLNIGVSWYEFTTGKLTDSSVSLNLSDMNYSELSDSIANDLSELRELVRRQNDENEALLEGLHYQLDLRTGQIESSIQNVLNQVTYQLTGTIEIGKSEIPKNEEEKPVSVGYFKYQSKTFPYTGNSFAGVNKAINLLDQKITAIHQDVVKGIEMPMAIPNLLPSNCEENTDEENKPTIDIDFENITDEALNNIRLKRGSAFQGFLLSTIFDFLLDMGIDWAKDKLIENIPFSQVNGYLTQILLEQTKNNQLEICQLKEAIEDIDPNLAVPDDYALRPDASIPRLIIIYRPKDKNNKSGNYTLEIPHYNGNKTPIIPEYKKGNHWARVILKDNSQMVVNAVTESKAKYILRQNLKYVNPQMKTDNFKVGEHPKKPFKEFDVKPYRADYYEFGKTQNYPTWQHYFENSI